MTPPATGSVSVNPADSTTPPAVTPVVEFPSGIPGFESHRRFVLIASAELSPLGCLKSVDSSDVSFLVTDPQSLSFGYDLTLSEAELARIGASPDDTLLWLAIVTITEHDANANLRAPVVINPARMLGCQVIREND